MECSVLYMVGTTSLIIYLSPRSYISSKSKSYSLQGEDTSYSNVFNLEGESHRQPSSGRKRKGRKPVKKNLLGTPKDRELKSSELPDDQ